MQYISLAGVAWLERYDLNIDSMIRRWTQEGTVTPRWSDWEKERRPDDHSEPDGDMKLQYERWILEQYNERFRYREMGTGHAKLTLAGINLPETILVSLPKIKPKLNDFAELPVDCIARDANGIVIRGNNISNNSIELLMRIDWYTMTIASILERM